VDNPYMTGQTVAMSGGMAFNLTWVKHTPLS